MDTKRCGVNRSIGVDTASKVVDLVDDCVTNSQGTTKVSLLSSKESRSWLWEPPMCDECLRSLEEGLAMERKHYRDKELKVRLTFLSIV